MEGVVLAAVSTPDFAEKATERNVVWAKMRGSPEWPAQILPEEAAETFLKNASRTGKALPVAVQFFGPGTVAYLSRGVIHSWQDGLDKKWHMKANTRKRMNRGVEQALEYVRESVMPQGWWTRWHAVPWDPNSGKEAIALEEREASGLGANNTSGAGHSDRFAGADSAPPSPASCDYHGSDWNEEEEMRKRMSEFVPIERNDWTRMPKLKMLKQNGKQKGDVAVCTCSSSVGNCTENCTNRATKFKCDPENCPCGSRCTNLPFDFIEHKKLEVFFTRNRGVGVKAKEPIRAGEFVEEYAGEVISDELRRRRIARGGGLLAGAYTMALDNGLYVDAYRKGNVARFVNSSCAPNCVVEKWTDAASGCSRLGIFAQTDIAPGEEVTYTYMLEAPDDMSKDDKRKLVCRCGTPNCRGTLVHRVSRHSIHHSVGPNAAEAREQGAGELAAQVQGIPPKKRVREECSDTCPFARGREKVPPLHDTQSAAQ